MYMAKKSQIKYYIPGAIALLLGIAAFCMMFLDAVTYVGKIGGSTISITGMDLAFGSKNTDIPGVTIEVLQFNIMVTLAFVLPLLGGIISLITGKSFIGKIIATACFVVGAVFLFSTTGFTAISFGSDTKDALLLLFNEKLAIGAIIGGVLAILGAVVSFFKGSIAKMIK